MEIVRNIFAFAGLYSSVGSSWGFPPPSKFSEFLEMMVKIINFTCYFDIKSKICARLRRAPHLEMSLWIHHCRTQQKTAIWTHGSPPNSLLSVFKHIIKVAYIKSKFGPYCRQGGRRPPWRNFKKCPFYPYKVPFWTFGPALFFIFRRLCTNILLADAIHM